MDATPEIHSKPPCSREDALSVVRRLHEAGHLAYFAGGCVRDALLGLQPKDYDVATDALPDRVRSLFSNTQAVGAAFGVILARVGKSVVEVATFRTDGDYTDGRRPSQVHFTNAEHDAQRRDFTINGLFFDPLTDQVIDYVGGREDLAARRLRAIGDPARRFEEDHLRLLRAVRFASRFGLQIEPATAAAIRQSAPRLKGISPERIGEELRMILTAPSRKIGWPLFWDMGLIFEIFRLFPLKPGTQLRQNRSLLLAVAPGRATSMGLALAAGALCVQLQQMPDPVDPRPLLAKKPIHHAVQALRQTLRLSNDETDEMSQTLSGIEPLLADGQPGVALLKRFLSRPTASLSRDLLEALAALGFYVNRIESLRRDLADLEREDFQPTPLLTGDDLTAAGFHPGPIFKQLLETVYDAQLEGRIKTREEAMNIAREMAQRPK